MSSSDPGHGPRLVLCATAQELAERAARHVAEVAERVLQRKTSFTLCLAGGSTPRETYRQLRRQRCAWPSWQFFFGDERCVPPDHPDSNYRMADVELFQQLPVSPLQVWRMQGEAEDVEASARNYERWLPAALDLLLLGMGEDGHTASLFPGSHAAAEAERSVLSVTGTKPPPRRLTITPRVIRGAVERVVLVSGSGKSEMLQRVLEGPFDARALPVQHALDGTWFVDAAAASVLRVSARPSHSEVE